jgi:signal peptidase I
MASGHVEILSERSKIPADGHSATKFCIRYAADQGAVATLHLAKRGSFEPDHIVREKAFAVVNGEVNFTVYPPTRPGSAILTGPGVKHRIDFVAANFMAGLVFEWVPTLFWAILLALVLRSYAVASYYIPSGSMENTLMERDLLIADKLSYKLLSHDPQRGDVMIFRYPEDPRLDYIKRIIGLPGDTVAVRDGIVYVNDAPLNEAYIKEKPFNNFGPVTVGPDEYFVMGDNRNHSSDSRVWGMVPRKNIEGRALFVFWPPQHIKSLKKD